MCKILAKKGPGQKNFSLMNFSMYWELKFQISAQLKEKSWKIEKNFYGSQMLAENTLCLSKDVVLAVQYSKYSKFT